MEENTEKSTTSKKLSSFLEKNNKVVVIICIVLLACVAGFICYEAVSSDISKKNLSKIDEIQFALTDGSTALEETELKDRRNNAIAELKVYAGKTGISAIRANMLAAELEFQNENYEAAVTYWQAVAGKAKKAYTAPIANYNLGVCYEKLNNLELACESYKKASENEDFVLKSHAAFSYGRVLEAMNKYNDAYEVYMKLTGSNPDDSWAKLAKTRMLDLEIQGRL